jgi:aminoglycoside 3-N-acetyltransferase
MGLLTELFRRLPGVQRSVHPTHPVAVWGSGASDMVLDHHLAATPCGAPSPYVALERAQGKILLMGTDISILTFYHYVEEVIESQLPESPFTRETYRLSSRLANGTVIETTTRLYEPSVSRRRNLSGLVVPLRQRGAWRTLRVGRLPLTVLYADAVVEVVQELARRGVYCYE